MNVEVVACPFCGSVPNIIHYKSETDSYYRIFCSKESCIMRDTKTWRFLVAENAANRWNEFVDEAVDRWNSKNADKKDYPDVYYSVKVN